VGAAGEDETLPGQESPLTGGKQDRRRWFGVRGSGGLGIGPRAWQGWRLVTVEAWLLVGVIAVVVYLIASWIR